MLARAKECLYLSLDSCAELRTPGNEAGRCPVQHGLMLRRQMLFNSGMLKGSIIPKVTSYSFALMKYADGLLSEVDRKFLASKLIRSRIPVPEKLNVVIDV
jgi:hypothetical protein